MSNLFRLFTIAFFGIIGLLKDCPADCMYYNTDIKILGTDSSIIEIKSSFDTTKIEKTDTISKSNFLSDMCRRYVASTICFIGTIDTIRGFCSPNRSAWQYSDSIHVAVDTVLKGKALVPSPLWSIENDYSYICTSMNNDLKISIEDYKSYESLKGKKFMFFADSLKSLNSTSVIPDLCRGDSGNRIDDSGYIWSDYPNWYRQQICLPLHSMIAAINQSSSIEYSVASSSLSIIDN